VPICLPEQPEFSTQSERLVWEHLRDGLDDEDFLIANQRVTDRFKDHEIDIAIVLPGAGLVVVEVKGSQVTCSNGIWSIERNGRLEEIHPVRQAALGKYATRSYVEHDDRWGSRRRIRWCHAVILPYTHVDDGFAQPDCPRWAVIGRNDMHALVPLLRDIAKLQETEHRVPDTDDVHAIAEILRGRLPPQRDLVGAAQERADVAERLTQEQAAVLDAIRLLPRVEVRGGAGSGKTWLALEQARRLGHQGLRVALMCYSRGLAAYLERRVAAWPRKDRPAYIGTFHGLGLSWGRRRAAMTTAPTGSTGCPLRWWSPRSISRIDSGSMPSSSTRLRTFADLWWPALLASLHDEESGRLYAFLTRDSACSAGTGARRRRWCRSCSTTTCATRARSATRSTR